MVFLGNNMENEDTGYEKKKTELTEKESKESYSRKMQQWHTHTHKNTIHHYITPALGSTIRKEKFLYSHT